jgi:tetratricopeptide (TPR) repeat protein
MNAREIWDKLVALMAPDEPEAAAATAGGLEPPTPASDERPGAPPPPAPGTSEGAKAPEADAEPPAPDATVQALGRIEQVLDQQRHNEQQLRRELQQFADVLPDHLAHASSQALANLPNRVAAALREVPLTRAKDHLDEAVEKMRESIEAQQYSLEQSADHQERMAETLERLAAALESDHRDRESHAAVLEQIRDQLVASDQRIRESIEAQGRALRKPAMILAAAIVLLAVGMIIVAAIA